MTFKDLAESFMLAAANRRNPLSPQTLRNYRQRIDNDILPLIGEMQVEAVDNVMVKAMVDEWVEEEVASTTMRLNFTIIKQILKSAVDSKGQPLYRMVWNAGFIEFPKVRPKKALVNAQTIQDGLSALLRGQCRECAVLVAILSGSGLRISEAMAVRLVNHGLGEASVWIPAESKIIVRQQVDRYTHASRPPKHKQEGSKLFREPKTEAGIREIDLAPELNQFMIRVFEKTQPGSLLFPNSQTYYGKIIRKAIKGGFHAFRRFRVTHLDKKGVPGGLSRYWAGHATGDVHKGYEQFEQEIETRKTEAARIGLGFELPEIA